MVRVTIWGTPEDVTEETMQKLTAELLEAVREYKPPDEKTYVAFPADQMKSELGKEIVVEIRGPVSVFLNTRRPLAEVVGEMVLACFPDSYVECEVHPEQLLSSKHQWRSKREPG